MSITTFTNVQQNNIDDTNPTSDYTNPLTIYTELKSGTMFFTQKLMIEHRLVLPSVLKIAVCMNNVRLLADVIKVLSDNKDITHTGDDKEIIKLIVDADMIFWTSYGLLVNVNHPMLFDTPQADAFRGLNMAFEYSNKPYIEETNTYIYTLIEYQDYRKEVEFEVLGVYTDEETAIEHAKRQNTEDEDPGQMYVGLDGDVLYDGLGDGNYTRVAVCKSVLNQEPTPRRLC